MTSDLDLWQTSNWQMPERSRLYRIAPLGNDSIMREALHSVLIRLALAHTVSPLVLMRREIVPETRIRHTKHSSSFTESHLKTMNGVGKYAAEFTRKLEDLTSQQKLSECSFMLWSGLLDPRALGLLYTHPRWCPMCFLEWRDAGHEPYLPLIWQAAPILVCPVHSMALQHECPSCRRIQPFVPRHAHVDFCSRCGSWLAANHKELKGIVKASRISPRQRYNIDAIGEMILHGPEISELLTAQHLQTRIAEIAERHFDGTVANIERALGFTKRVISQWRYRNVQPSLPALLLMTQGLRTTPVAFLRDGLDDSFTAPPQRQFRPPTRRTLDLSVKQRTALTDALRNIIAEGYSEFPMKDVAERLGYKYTYLRYWFEDECRQISRLHRHWVLAQRKEKEVRDAELTTQLVRAVYSTYAHVTRRHIEKCLREAGLSLANPVVREAANRVKFDHFSACRPVQHHDPTSALAYGEHGPKDCHPPD
ncbi:TniQ family protein [Burkholderia sp. MSMB1826]|uniref:TniQ family protein n=1 Tax=Burkholderia sp. MSMB1826 TaxID=1637875 RepID=UPI0009E923BE|nr:TniQ family protein [Burkholderia sp. MSMB1826]